MGGTDRDPKWQGRQRQVELDRGWSLGVSAWELAGSMEPLKSQGEDGVEQTLVLRSSF